MKINKIVIKNYKNLVDCTVDFARCKGVAVVAGINGSGKSNFLEAVSLALLHVKREHSVYRENAFGYEIDYEVDGQRVIAHCNAGSSEIEWEGVPKDVQPEVPRRVIAMYSGEFSRLLGCGYISYLDYSVVDDMILLSGGDLPAALLFFALKDRGNLSSLAGFTREEMRGLVISYRIHNADIFLHEEPGDEIQGILYDLAENDFDDMREHELTMSDFLEIVEARLSIDDAGAEWVARNLVGDLNGESLGMTDIVFAAESSNGSRFSQYDLSEGEKRLILLGYIYEALVDDRSVVLLDEPDAHVHESKKLDIFDMVVRSADKGCTTIMTTHSPALIEYVPAKNLVCFELEDGVAKVRQDVDFDVIANLTDSRLSFFSTRPIMLFEGKSDIFLLTNAMEALRRLHPEKYKDVSLVKQFDLYMMGGTGNAASELRLFREKFPRRKIVVVLDGDKSGKKAFKDILESYDLPETMALSPEGAKRIIDSDTMLLIPPAPNGVSGEYAIEDYIDKDYLNSRVQSYLENPQYKSFTSMPKIKADLKKELGNRVLIPPPPDSAFAGFQTIIDCLLAQ